MASPKPHPTLEEAITTAQRRAQQIRKPIYIVAEPDGFVATRVQPPGTALDVIYPQGYRPKQEALKTEFTHELDLEIAKDTIRHLTDDSIVESKAKSMEPGENYMIVIASAPFSFETRFASTLKAKLTTREGVSWFVFDNGVIIENQTQFQAYLVKG